MTLLFDTPRIVVDRLQYATLGWCGTRCISRRVYVASETCLLLAAMFLGETVAPSQLVGGALILIAVVLLARAAPSE